MTINMVDLKTQYQHIQDDIDSAVLEVIRSCQYINGPAVKRFKKNLSEYLGAHVIPCANGTDALQIALMALGLQAGDEVITPAFTYIATAEVIALLKLKPVFVDVDPHTFNLDPSKLEAAITDKTKVIIPVHLFGQSADMEPILQIANKHNIFVVEDNAQAIGSTYTFANGQRMKAGTIGHIGTTSFYPSKNLGAYGDGGAIFARDEALAQRIQVICNHGSSKRYYHHSIGVNSRLDSIQAAILDAKLKHLDVYTANRQKAADMYDDAFANLEGIVIPKRAHNATHVFHQYTLRVLEGRQKRDAIRQWMSEHKVPTMIYYPLPLHEQPAYAHYADPSAELPVSERLSAEVISLPMHSELTEDQINFITQTFKEAVAKA